MILRLCSGSSIPASRSMNRSSARTWTSCAPEAVAEGLDHLVGLVLSHQAVVHEYAGELVSDRPVDERRGGRRVDPAGQAADDLGFADLRPDPLDLLVDDRSRRPALLAAGDVAQEALEDLRAVRGVDDLGMELDAVEPALGALERSDRRAGAGRQGPEALGGLEDAVAMAHPALLLFGQAAQQLATVAGENQLGPAELAGVRPLDAAAQLVDHRLHPVTDAQHRDIEIEQLGAKRRSPLRVHGRGAARQHQGGRPALADAVQRDVVREHLGEHAALADAASDQLRVLPAEVEDQHLLPRGGGRPVGRLELGDGRRRGQLGVADGDLARPGLVLQPHLALGLVGGEAGFSHPRRRLPRQRWRARSTPCRRTAPAGASCPRSAAPARP